MSRKAKASIKRLLVNQQIWISTTTSKRKIVRFLDSVKPIKTDHDLIRIGGDSDGGYLVPDDLEGIRTCFSPGVSSVANFEADLAKRGIRCFLADYSVEKPPVDNPLFDFEKKYLGAKDNDVFMTLESWVDSKSLSREDSILQMDIEGAEYSVIFDTSLETLSRFRILVIEFHKLDHLFSEAGFELIDLTFAKILKNFDVVHIHPNNCVPPTQGHGLEVPPVMEFTFLRKDRVSARSNILSFPHSLDRANVTRKRDFALPRCWYAAS